MRLKFSDQFDGNDGVDVSAKFKRMWFLVQLLKTIELNKNAGSMKVTCNAIAGEIVVECPRMKLHQTMQHAFEKLMIALDSMYNLDRRLEGLHIFEGDQWDFNLLAQHLNRDVATAADRFAFQHCLFSMFYGGGFGISNECCQLLSNRLQQFVRHARQLGSCDSLVFQGKKTVDSLKEMFLNDEIAEDIRWEFLHHYILLRPKYAVRVVELVLGYRNHYFVINPSFSYKLEFYFLPVQPLSVNEKELNNVLREHGPEYASQRAKNHYSAYSRKIRSDLF